MTIFTSSMGVCLLIGLNLITAAFVFSDPSGPANIWLVALALPFMLLGCPSSTCEMPRPPLPPGFDVRRLKPRRD